jgi:hypothetical protein
MVRDQFKMESDPHMLMVKEKLKGALGDNANRYNLHICGACSSIVTTVLATPKLPAKYLL